MHFAHIDKSSGTKLSKVAVVAAIHVVIGLALIHSMNSKKFSMPKAMETILELTPEIVPPPPPPPAPPEPVQQAAPAPEVFRPVVEVDVAPVQPEPQIQTTSVADPAPATPGPVAAAAPAEPSSNSGVMRTAVLADAKGCATPEYPARAARNGESGTVALALLVGTDGRVAGSRVQQSSGSKDLDRAALAALSMCKFKPATSGGVAEQAWASIAYVWKLEQ